MLYPLSTWLSPCMIGVANYCSAISVLCPGHSVFPISEFFSDSPPPPYMFGVSHICIRPYIYFLRPGGISPHRSLHARCCSVRCDYIETQHMVHMRSFSNCDARHNDTALKLARSIIIPSIVSPSRLFPIASSFSLNRSWSFLPFTSLK